MPRPGIIPARNHWCLHNDQLAQEFDWILNLIPTFPGCAKSPAGSIFFAPLSSNLDELVAGLTPDYSRSLEGLYQPTPGQWAIAPDGVPRFESGYLLMEPAATNLCTCYSFPDAGLTNISVTANGDLTREIGQPAELAGIGNGHCVRLNGARGSARADIAGLVANLSAHTWSGWARWISGAGVCQIQDYPPSTLAIPVPKDGQWHYLSDVHAPNATSDRWCFFVGADTIGEFVFANLKEEQTLSTPIITRGASASRGADSLTYPGVNSVFNQAQGMAAVDWIPKHAQSDSFSDIALATLQDVANILYYNASNDRLTSFDGINESNVLVNPFSGGESFRSVALYGPAGTGADRLSAGVYQGGAWDWDTNNNRTYGGSFPATPNELRLMWLADAPGLIRNVTLWDVNQGRAWIEANWSP